MGLLSVCQLPGGNYKHTETHRSESIGFDIEPCRRGGSFSQKKGVCAENIPCHLPTGKGHCCSVGTKEENELKLFPQSSAKKASVPLLALARERNVVIRQNSLSLFCFFFFTLCNFPIRFALAGSRTHTGVGWEFLADTSHLPGGIVLMMMMWH